MLKTTADIPFTSPVAHALQGQTATAMADAYETVGLADFSGNSLIHLRGKEAAAALEKAPEQIGQVTVMKKGLAVKLRPDEFLLIGTAGVEIESRLDALLSVTDMTHGRGHFLLVGNKAPHVLAKISGLDFSDKRFPANFAAQTSLAKVRTLIVRRDIGNTPAYRLIMGYPAAEYTWSVVFDALREFGGVYVK